VVAIVIVSHSATLAEGVAELAREMGGKDVVVEVAGGLDEPGRPLGTDAVLVARAIERAQSNDGVLVLMDLGSAVMSAEMALEMIEGEGRDKVTLSDAPLAEGAVAAAATASTGAALDDVAREARAGLTAKTEHLGSQVDTGTVPVERTSGIGEEVRMVVSNSVGLHARPAARFVKLAGRFDADVEVTNSTRNKGPVNGRSIMAVTTLDARQGDEIVVRATGSEAGAVLQAIEDLAKNNFGDE
jgi:multiphosphoryl transfer protein